MLFFLMGSAVGALVVFWLGAKARARADRLEEENLQLAQQKQIVIDFMHHMVEALGEGLTREQLFQRIVHAAILSTEALGAWVFLYKTMMFSWSTPSWRKASIRDPNTCT